MGNMTHFMFTVNTVELPEVDVLIHVKNWVLAIEMGQVRACVLFIEGTMELSAFHKRGQLHRKLARPLSQQQHLFRNY